MQLLNTFVDFNFSKLGMVNWTNIFVQCTFNSAFVWLSR